MKLIDHGPLAAFFTSNLAPQLSAAACAAVVLVAVPAGAVTKITITSCGQKLDRGSAILMADLDCSGFNNVAVELGNTKLDLNGFTLTGAAPANFPSPTLTPAINCLHCKIKGPGTIIGSQVGISALRVALRDQVVVRDAENMAINASKVSLRSSMLLSNGRAFGAPAILVGRKLRMRDSRVADNGTGVLAFDKVRIKVVDSTIENNRGTEPFLLGQVGYGIDARKGRVTLKNSQVRNNAPIPDPPKSRCQIFGCGDINTDVAPKMKASGCDTSVDTDSGGDGGSAHGICDNDADFDADTVGNDTDLCDYDPACTSEDADADGIGDCCDNCPADANAAQFDSDHDGIGDACDPTPI